MEMLGSEIFLTAAAGMMEVSVPTHHCLGFTFFRDCSSSRWMSFSTAVRRRTPGRGRDTLHGGVVQWCGTEWCGTVVWYGGVVRWCGACETIALAAIKVLHCTGGARAGGIPATHVSEAPMLHSCTSPSPPSM